MSSDNDVVISSLENIDKYLDSVKEDVEDISSYLNNHSIGIFTFEKKMKNAEIIYFNLQDFKNNIQTINDKDVESKILNKKYLYIWKKIQFIIEYRKEKEINSKFIETYLLLAKELKNLFRKSKKDTEEFNFLMSKIKSYENWLSENSRFVDVDIKKSFNFYTKKIYYKWLEEDGSLIEKINENFLFFEKGICEFEKKVETMSYDINRYDDLLNQIEKFKKEVLLEFKVISKYQCIEVKMYSKKLIEILNKIKKLYYCICEDANFNKALKEIESVNKLGSLSGSENDIEELGVKIKSINLMLKIMKNSDYKIKLRDWLDNSMDNYFEEIKKQHTNEMYDMWLKNLEYHMQMITEKDEKFKQIICNNYGEAEFILDQLHKHENEIIELNCKIKNYEKLPYFAECSLFEKSKTKLNIFLKVVREKINELSKELENERTFVLQFIDIWNSWKNAIRFNKENIDVTELKIWRKNCQKFSNQYSLFKTSYRNRHKKFLVTDNLLDKLSPNGNDRLMSDYKIYVDEITQIVTDGSFRFSQTQQEIEDIFAIENLDDTITELEECVNGEVNINNTTNDDIEKLINRFESIYINDRSKQEDLDDGTKELNNLCDTSEIINDYEDDGTTIPDVTFDEDVYSENLPECLEINYDNESKNFWSENLCITGLRITFSTLVFGIVIFFSLILYNGREEFLPCCFREFWWIYFRRDGRPPF
uniref:KASH domain-containing protein n=1 Tax=Strongyloides stercoralis TaxID=6248 RepID=A0A0K0DX73_STRER